MDKRLLYAAVVIAEIGYGLFLLVASLIAVGIIPSPLVLGLTGTVHLGVRIVCCYAFGRIGDRVGSKALMLPACALYIASFAVLGLGSVSAVFAAYILSGIACSIFWPLMEAWIGHGSHDTRLIRFLGFFGVCFTGGIAIGSFSGGFFMRFAPAVSIAAGCAIWSIVALFIIAIPDRYAHGVDGNASGGSFVPPGRTAMMRRFMLVGWIANFATWIGIGIMRFLFNKLCVNFGIEADTIGIINAVLYGSWSLSFLLLMNISGWVYRFWPLALMQLAGLCAMAVMGIASTPDIFMISCVLFGACASITYFSSVFYGQNGAANRGAKSGLHEMILGSGTLVGPFLGGALAQAFSLQAPFFAAAAIIAAAIAAEYILLRKASPRR